MRAKQRAKICVGHFVKTGIAVPQGSPQHMHTKAAGQKYARLLAGYIAV